MECAEKCDQDWKCDLTLKSEASGTYTLVCSNLK